MKKISVSLIFIGFFTAFSMILSAPFNWLLSKHIDFDRQGSPVQQILLVAFDSQTSLETGRPDSLFIWHLETGKLTSVPRDLSVSIDGIPLVTKHLGISDCAPACSIQDVYLFSILEHYRSPSAKSIALQRLRDAIAYEYRIATPAVITFDLTWAYSALTRIGPVEVDVNSPVPVGGIYLNGYQGVERYLPTGKQKLAGQDLYWFARARFGTSNSDRIDRQANLLKAIMQQKNKIELASAVMASRGEFQTDLAWFELPRLFLVPTPKF